MFAQSQTFKIIIIIEIIGKLVTCHRFEVTMSCKYLLTILILFSSSNWIKTKLKLLKIRRKNSFN